jgi:uncharacterized membrane-anchored protein
VVIGASWRENVEANLANDDWLMWLGGGVLACLVTVLIAGVVEAFRPPDDE